MEESKEETLYIDLNMHYYLKNKTLIDSYSEKPKCTDLTSNSVIVYLTFDNFYILLSTQESKMHLSDPGEVANILVKESPTTNIVELFLDLYKDQIKPKAYDHLYSFYHVLLVRSFNAKNKDMWKVLFQKMPKDVPYYTYINSIEGIVKMKNDSGFDIFTAIFDNIGVINFKFQLFNCSRLIENNNFKIMKFIIDKTVGTDIYHRIIDKNSLAMAIFYDRLEFADELLKTDIKFEFSYLYIHKDLPDSINHESMCYLLNLYKNKRIELCEVYIIKLIGLSINEDNKENFDALADIFQNELAIYSGKFTPEQSYYKTAIDKAKKNDRYNYIINYYVINNNALPNSNGYIRRFIIRVS